MRLIGEMQRRQAVLEARQTAVERVRILFAPCPESACRSPSAHRREDVMRARRARPGAPITARRVAIASDAASSPGVVVDSRPSDDVELVHVADAVNVAARIEQRAHDVEVRRGGSPVQRVGVVSGLARIRIGAVLEQQPARRPGARSWRRRAVPVQPACGARGLLARASAGSLASKPRSSSTSPAAHASKKRATSRLLPPIDLGLQRAPAGETVVLRDARAEPSRACARGSVRRSSCSRSFASFFRYSSEARSGSCDLGIDPSFRCRPASASLGLEVRVSDY